MIKNFLKLRKIFTQGLRFQNIILQSTIPEVTNSLKIQKFQTNIDVDTNLIISLVECQILELERIRNIITLC